MFNLLEGIRITQTMNHMKFNTYIEKSTKTIETITLDNAPSVEL